MPEEKSYCRFMGSETESTSGGGCLASDKFCHIIENTLDAIITFNMDGVITSWNSSAEKIYQYTPEEVLGKPYIIVPKERKDEFRQIIERMKQEEQIPDYETQRMRKDGSLVDVSIAFFPLNKKVGRVTEFCSIHRDISERKKLQREMNRAQELATIGQLAAGIAHALNTPLASILMSAQMLKDDLPTDSTKDDMDRIERQVVRCKGIVRNLLNLARPFSTVRERTQINKLIEQVKNNIEPILKGKIVDFQLELDPELPMIVCNPQAVEELLSNLISNAGDAISTMGTISVKSYRKENNIVLIIKDSGNGISPEHIKKVFDPFFSTKDIGKGTGLGLAVCARIVHDQNGTIRVDSTPGNGTCFTIQLPIQPIDSKIPVAVS